MEFHPSKPHFDFLTGLRGLLTLQFLVWSFLSLLFPAAVQAVDAAHQTHATASSSIIRKVLSPILWNQALIYSSFIFLSARSVCIPFLASHSRLDIARPVFQRGVRLWAPVTLALLLAWLLLKGDFGDDYNELLELTHNRNIEPLRKLKDAGVYFNAVFNVFWVNKFYYSQAANTAFPLNTLWSISLIYQQSYTVYMTVVIIPYTTVSFRRLALPIFIITAWWVQSWAWYSITALFLADLLTNSDSAKFTLRAGQPLQIRYKTSMRPIKRTIKIPIWPITAALAILVGFILQYIYAAYQPEWGTAELRGHAGLYDSGGLSGKLDTHQPQARMDNYLIICGVYYFLELSQWKARLQTILAWRGLTALGRRSLSYFLMTPVVLGTAGVQLSSCLFRHHGWSLEGANGIAAAVMLAAIPIVAEVFYRGVDRPSKWFANWLWRFMTT